MSYNANDPSQNAYWDEELAVRLDGIAQELYGQAEEAQNLGFRREEAIYRNVYRAVLEAARALRDEAAYLRAQPSA